MYGGLCTYYRSVQMGHKVVAVTRRWGKPEFREASPALVQEEGVGRTPGLRERCQ